MKKEREKKTMLDTYEKCDPKKILENFRLLSQSATKEITIY